MKDQAKSDVSVWDLRCAIANMQVVNENVHGFFAQLDYTFHDSFVKMLDSQKAYLGHESDYPYESYVPLDEDHPTHKRTRLWVPRLLQILQKFQDKTCMIQVGNDHCVGPNGLPELLKKRGWIVKPVCDPAGRALNVPRDMEMKHDHFGDALVTDAPVTAGG